MISAHTFHKISSNSYKFLPLPLSTYPSIALLFFFLLFFSSFFSSSSLPDFVCTPHIPSTSILAMSKFSIPQSFYGHRSIQEFVRTHHPRPRHPLNPPIRRLSHSAIRPQPRKSTSVKARDKSSLEKPEWQGI